MGNNGRGINVRKNSSRVNGECAINIIQRVWRGSRIRRNLTATERIPIRTGGDRGHVALHKNLRVINKKLRQSISRRVTGSGRKYDESLSIGQSPSIVIQRYVRRFLANKLRSKMRREYVRRLLANKLNTKIKMTKDGDAILHLPLAVPLLTRLIHPNHPLQQIPRIWMHNLAM